MQLPLSSSCSQQALLAVLMGLVCACGALQDTSAIATAEAAGAVNSTASGPLFNGSFVLSPNVEVGPFWVEEQLNRSDVTTDPTTSQAQAGVPLTLDLKIYEVSGTSAAALGNVTVDLWQANAAGLYSDESQENTVGAKWLRGYQVSDGNGTVQFKTIVPGWYSGRTSHIHFRLRTTTSGNKTFNWTTQLFFSDSFTNKIYSATPYSAHANRDTYTTNDRLYQTRVTADGNSYLTGDLLLVTPVQTSSGYAAAANLFVDANPG